MTVHEGDFYLAFEELNKLQLKPFLERIWKSSEGGPPTEGAKAGMDQVNVADDNNDDGNNTDE